MKYRIKQNFTSDVTKEEAQEAILLQKQRKKLAAQKLVAKTAKQQREQIVVDAMVAANTMQVTETLKKQHLVTALTDHGVATSGSREVLLQRLVTCLGINLSPEADDSWPADGAAAATKDDGEIMESTHDETGDDGAQDDTEAESYIGLSADILTKLIEEFSVDSVVKADVIAECLTFAQRIFRQA